MGFWDGLPPRQDNRGHSQHSKSECLGKGVCQEKEHLGKKLQLLKNPIEVEKTDLIVPSKDLKQQNEEYTES